MLPGNSANKRAILFVPPVAACPRAPGGVRFKACVAGRCVGVCPVEGNRRWGAWWEVGGEGERVGVGVGRQGEPAGWKVESWSQRTIVGRNTINVAETGQNVVVNRTATYGESASQPVYMGYK